MGCRAVGINLRVLATFTGGQAKAKTEKSASHSPRDTLQFYNERELVLNQSWLLRSYSGI